MADAVRHARQTQWVTVRPIRIAVDALGGDAAPREIVRGALGAAARFPDVQVILAGPIDTLKQESGPTVPANIFLRDAPEVIGMGEEPAKAVRSKPQSSLVVAARMVREGEADAVVSAGNTGATMAAALLVIGRIAEIARPAIAVTIPTPAGPVVLVDAGANAECKPVNMLQFAKMGRAYATSVLGIESPRVGLLSIGQESSKGNELVRNTWPMLEESDLHFVGNVEGQDIMAGRADIVVTDGFTGNVVLKVLEGLAGTIFSELRSGATRSLRGRLGGMLMRPALRELTTKLDRDEYGGTPLLGVAGVCIIGHGSSNAKSISNAIGAAARAVKGDIVDRLARDITKKGE